MALDGAGSTNPAGTPLIQITRPTTPPGIDSHFGRHLVDARQALRSGASGVSKSDAVDTPKKAASGETLEGSIPPQVTQNTGAGQVGRSTRGSMDALNARLAGLFTEPDPYSDEKIPAPYSDKIVSTDDAKMVVTGHTDLGKIPVIDPGKMVSTDDDKMVAGPASGVSHAGWQQTSVQALRVQTITRQATAIADQLLNDHGDAIAAGTASPLASVVSSAMKLATNSARKHIDAALDKAKGDLARKAASDAVTALAEDDKAVKSIIAFFRDENGLDQKTFNSLLDPKLPRDGQDLRRLAGEAKRVASASLGEELARTFGLVPSAVNAMLDVKINARVENPEALKILAHHVAESALLATAGTPIDDEASDIVAAKLNDIEFLDVTLQGSNLDATGEQAAIEAAEALYADSAVTSAMQNFASAKAQRSLLSEIAPRLLAWVEENPAAAATSSPPGRQTGRQVSESPAPTSTPDRLPSYESLARTGPFSASASGQNQNAPVQSPALGNITPHRGSSPARRPFGILNRLTTTGSQNRSASPGASGFTPPIPARLHRRYPPYGTGPQTSRSSFNPGWAAGLESLGVASSQAPAVEEILRQVFEAWIPRNLPTFAQNVKVLNGPAFEALYEQYHRGAGNVATVNAFTNTASDGTVRIWMRKGFDDEHALAYSLLLHAYVHPAFRRLAGNCIVDQGGGNNSNLSSGIVYLIASRLSDLTVVGRRDVEIARDIWELMGGDEKCYRAVFRGDPAALKDFKELAEVLGIVVSTHAE